MLNTDTVLKIINEKNTGTIKTIISTKILTHLIVLRVNRP